MVDVERDEDPNSCRFVLQPNQSISWRALKLWFLGLCAASGSVATGMAIVGYWPILPFAGLEMLAVGSGLYVVARRGQMREIIYIDNDSVKIERGRNQPEQEWILARVWAKVTLERCPKQWYPSRLLIRSHGRAIEIGSFLNEDERQQLAQQLSQNLSRAR